MLQFQQPQHVMMAVSGTSVKGACHLQHYQLDGHMCTRKFSVGGAAGNVV